MIQNTCSPLSIEAVVRLTIVHTVLHFPLGVLLRLCPSSMKTFPSFDCSPPGLFHPKNTLWHEAAWHQHAAAQVWGHHQAASASSPASLQPVAAQRAKHLDEPHATRQTQRHKLAGSDREKNNSGENKTWKKSNAAAPCKTLHWWREYVTAETVDVSLTWLRWREARRANSQLAPSEWSFVSGLWKPDSVA